MRRRFAAQALWAVLICVTSGASASQLYGLSSPGTTPLYSVNQSTGALSVIGNTGFANITDLTSDPVTGTLWGVDTGTNQLLKIDPGTGAASVVAHLDTPSPIVSIAFDPVSRRLFGNTASGFGINTTDTLYAIDPSTGSATVKGPLGLLFSRVYALGFDQDGTLFGVADFSKQLIKIDTNSGAATAIARLSVNAAFDIASRPEDNVMFLADSTSQALYTLNTADGVLTEVGSFGLESAVNLSGLAFLIPEPSIYLSLAVGLALFACARRHLAR